MLSREEKLEKRRLWRQSEKGKSSREKYLSKQRENQRRFSKTELGRKRYRIKNWRKKGIISDDWELVYDRYLQTTHCDFCKCELNTSDDITRKCLDHDHSIKDRDNVRGILCNSCNVKDVFNPNETVRKDNKSGFRNISFQTREKRWMFNKRINKKDFTITFKTKKEAICYKFIYTLKIKSNI